MPCLIISTYCETTVEQFVKSLPPLLSQVNCCKPLPLCLSAPLKHSASVKYTLVTSLLLQTSQESLSVPWTQISPVLGKISQAHQLKFSSLQNGTFLKLSYISSSSKDFTSTHQFKFRIELFTLNRCCTQIKPKCHEFWEKFDKHPPVYTIPLFPQ